VLKIRSLSLEFKKFALKDISFEVGVGKTHIIIGKTGSGKTLLLETIAGFNQVQKGDIYINNQNCIALAIENRNIAYLPQDLALFSHLNVEQNILYAPRIKRSIPQSLSFSKQLIQATGIEHLLKRKIHNLSGGEKQRVALVRALMTKSKLILLDEPFSALDQNTKEELYLLIKKLQQEFGFSILAVTHDLEEAFFLADTISVMSEGIILQTGSKKDLYQNPKSVEIASFLGVTNIFDATIEQINGNLLILHVKEWSTKISVNTNQNTSGFTEKQQIKFGFRKNSISILTTNQISKNKMFGKVILSIEKITTHQILLEIKNSPNRILIEIPSTIFKESKITLNQTQILAFSIHLESIFIFSS
jgi:ABC-type Fe3+/spermidine/putrescine transport system ATPase subunit